MEGFLEQRLLRRQMCEENRADDTVAQKQQQYGESNGKQPAAWERAAALTYVVSEPPSELRCASEKCWRMCLSSSLCGSSDFREALPSKRRLSSAAECVCHDLCPHFSHNPRNRRKVSLFMQTCQTDCKGQCTVFYCLFFCFIVATFLYFSPFCYFCSSNLSTWGTLHKEYWIKSSLY